MSTSPRTLPVTAEGEPTEKAHATIALQAPDGTGLTARANVTSKNLDQLFEAGVATAAMAAQLVIPLANAEVLASYPAPLAIGLMVLQSLALVMIYVFWRRSRLSKK
ncbi:hypothetical protein ABGB17_02570 [Sphaerisporangium sp. B11E5]|uniref:hypothetical protein n=1 Tax=Sphaerisporangium sp. B11E5 TaxID=3153563 RepID=UPI00325EA81E